MNRAKTAVISFFYSLLNGGFAPNKTFNSRFGFEHWNISLQIYCDVKNTNTAKLTTATAQDL